MTDHDPDVSKLINETYHSTLETNAWKGLRVVYKRSRHQHDPRTLARFSNEVAALKATDTHENVAKILDFDQQQLVIILRLEFGQSLDRFVDTDMMSTLSSAECMTIWKQMAGALTYLHSRSIIHDDVKPDNIMWSNSHQRSVLIDFGAALIDMPEGYFNPSGTPNYAPPEFLLHEKSAKGDIWGLGVAMLFAFGYLPLPDGEWILPHALDEDSQERAEMLQWFQEVDGIREKLTESRPIVAMMLAADPYARVGSEELLRRLGTI